MAKYYNHQTNYHQRKKHITYVKRIIILCVLIVLVGAVGIAADIIRNNRHKDQPVSQQTTIIQQLPVNVLRSQYFQFQASTGWVEVQSAHIPNEFVYRNISNNQTKQELDIYVNQLPTNILAEYVAPVQVIGSNHFVASTVSNHCNTSLPANNQKRIPTQVAFQKVTFICNVDGTDFTAIAGETNGTPLITLNRINKTSATYYIVYKDITVSPNLQTFATILNTFVSR
ncbi:MAG: hypothetical protein NVSMB46_04680 [Candidatus Saccharimonadales bacterium]